MIVFNSTYRLGATLAPLNQEEIINTPEFYAMSREAIVASGKCPAHLKTVLDALPWTGRPNFVQVRPQDFRKRVPHVLGDGWHVDLNTSLANGRMHLAKSLDEYRSMVVSFGDVAETEFIKGPIKLDCDERLPFDHVAFFDKINASYYNTVTLAPDQVATYTSRDIHRINPNIRLGRARLIIVTVELDEAIEAEGGIIKPAIRERDLNQGA